MDENSATADVGRAFAETFGSSAPESKVARSLQAIRQHLGMEVAYVSEFVDNRTVFREVDAPGLEALIKVGDSHSLDDVYCRHILEGRIPQLMADTSVNPMAASMPITSAVPIGKHISVPIHLPDGEVYGMFCCLGPQADHSLRERDLQMMKVFADLTAFEIARDLTAKKAAAEKEARIKAVIEDHKFSIAYQPIWQIGNGRPSGFECLTRFAATPARSPDKWFNEAAETGFGTILEIAAIEQALRALPSLPPDIYLAVNASPETILSDDLAQVLKDVDAPRVVLEVTEHASVADYDLLARALQPLRDRGFRVAVDDAGAGYSSLSHILRLQPNLIKLDMGLTRDIDKDPVRQALTAALVSFAMSTNSKIIAEGVETLAELEVMGKIGVHMTQGYYLGRPRPLADAIKLFDEPSAKRVA